jgi:hypothetical protein
VKKAVRERLLKEMLSGIQDPTGSGWKVLVLDEFTTKVMSTSCRMSDILDTGQWRHQPCRAARWWQAHALHPALRTAAQGLQPAAAGLPAARRS